MVISCRDIYGVVNETRQRQRKRGRERKHIDCSSSSTTAVLNKFYDVFLSKERDIIVTLERKNSQSLLQKS